MAKFQNQWRALELSAATPQKAERRQANGVHGILTDDGAIYRLVVLRGGKVVFDKSDEDGIVIDGWINSLVNGDGGRSQWEPVDD